MELCRCGSGKAGDECCLPYLKGLKSAPTAEALMRSRYTAYALVDVDYLVKTHDAPADDEVDREATGKWARESEWLGLEIKATEKGGVDDDVGTVEFVARYKAGGVEQAHHERSQFRKKDGQWLFVDGVAVKPKPVRAAPSVGRNEACPCGSGKKFKRCHGA